MDTVDMLRVLTDVADELVTADQHDTYGIPADVPTGDGEAYRLLLVDAITRAWVMRPLPDDKPGTVPLVLTTLGEFVAARMNPGRYTSGRVFEVRDGKLGTQAVAR
ncbi:hypothetical protein ACGFIW_01380 [Micromonospora sp. NPDC048935]|uniref:hypothetical protein n=1 Tax=Micromonospora sp. NPDC048935 TaxID=3364262 RepID=UPI003718A14B